MNSVVMVYLIRVSNCLLFIGMSMLNILKSMRLIGALDNFMRKYSSQELAFDTIWILNGPFLT